MENKEVNIILLSNDRDFKWDFINFYSHTYNNKCLIPCKLQINGTEFCLGGEQPEGEKQNMIDVKFKVKEKNLHFMGSRYQEVKKTKLNKILSELNHIDAVICMFSKLYPVSYLLTGIEALLEHGGNYIIKKFFFIKNEHTLSLNHINLFFRYVANTNFSKDHLLPYDYPLYSKLIERGFNLGQTNVEPSQFTEAKKSFEDFLNIITASTSNMGASTPELSLSTRNLHNALRQLFELLCEIYNVLKKNESALERAISNKESYAEHNELIKEKSMLFCNDLYCSKPEIVTSTGSLPQPCFSNISEVNLIPLNCTRCKCSFNDHRISDYMNNLIYVTASKEYVVSPHVPLSIDTIHSLYGVGTFEEAISIVRKSILFAMKFIESIIVYGQVVLKLNQIYYRTYIDTNRALHPTLRSACSKKYNTPKLIKEKAYIIFNSFNELKHSTYLYKLIIKNLEEKKLWELKDMVWSTKDELKKSVSKLINLPQENNVIQKKLEAKTVVDSKTKSDTVQTTDVENIKLIKLMQQTIKDFTEEMRDLRNICKSNQDGIARMSSEITCLRAEVAFLRSEVSMQESDKC